MKNVKAPIVGAVILSVLLLVVGVCLGICLSIGGVIGKAGDSVPSSGEAADGLAQNTPQTIQPADAGTAPASGIAIPGFDSMTFVADQHEQAVALENPERNACYMTFTIILPDGSEIYRSGLVAPGAFVTTIWLERVPAAGSYEDSVLRYECFDLNDGQTPMNGAEIKFDLEVIK